ncbi:hypothetical protein GCM10027035_18670 [Emticicia sediminis]
MRFAENERIYMEIFKFLLSFLFSEIKKINFRIAPLAFTRKAAIKILSLLSVTYAGFDAFT